MHGISRRVRLMHIIFHPFAPMPPHPTLQSPCASRQKTILNSSFFTMQTSRHVVQVDNNAHLLCYLATRTLLPSFSPFASHPFRSLLCARFAPLVQTVLSYSSSRPNRGCEQTLLVFTLDLDVHRSHCLLLFLSQARSHFLFPSLSQSALRCSSQ